MKEVVTMTMIAEATAKGIVGAPRESERPILVRDATGEGTYLETLRCRPIRLFSR